MKVLWVTNTIFPLLCKKIGLSEPVGGGWMYGLAQNLSNNEEIQLAVATIYDTKNLKSYKIENITYFLIPSKSLLKYEPGIEKYWKIINDEFKSDIVHIHGTEFSHGLSIMKAFPHLNYVISIQGLVSIIERYYLAGISNKEIRKSFTFRDIIRFDTLFQAKNKFKKRGLLEKEYFLRSKHVIGRTSWDYAHAKTLNPNINYHFCNESLRESFYTSAKWDINNKQNYSLFCSQATYPIKGLHKLLKAVAILKSNFPQIKLRIAGANITKTDTITEKIKLSGYGSYLKTLINKYRLEENVVFTGKLLEKQIIQEYQRAHIFICPSSIENSSNSIGEAQIIGVPVIASYVGGIPDMVIHNFTGLLYRFEEVEMLAEYIRQIFSNDDLAIKLSLNSIIESEKRHNREVNLANTISIYKKIINAF